MTTHVQQVRGDEGVRERLRPVRVAGDDDPGPDALDPVELGVDVDACDVGAGTRALGQVPVDEAVPGLDVAQGDDLEEQCGQHVAGSFAAIFEDPAPGDPGPPLVRPHLGMGASCLGRRGRGTPRATHAATAPWVRTLTVNYEAQDLVGLSSFANVAAWMDRFLARPAVQRGLTVGAA